MSSAEVFEDWYHEISHNRHRELDIEVARTCYNAGYNQAVRDTTVQEPITPSPLLPIGWVCPKCGAGNAPFNPRCPCVGWPELKVTC